MEQQLFDYLSKYMVLTEEEKQRITELSIFNSFKKGDILLKESEYSNDAYFVMKGCIRSYYIIDGEEKTTAFYTEMETLAPLCSINNQPSEHYIACVEDSIILISNAAMEQATFAAFPRFETLCRILTEELVAKKQATLDDFKTSTPEQRYLNLQASRPDLLQRVPQHQIASYLGITPQSLSRIRKRLAEE